jgi:hypothetical protein
MWFELSPGLCNLRAVGNLIKATAGLALVFYILASMHCMLESVPGFDFLKSCCFVEQDSGARQDCETDECVVESGNYRAEDPTVLVPQPFFMLVLFSPLFEEPLSDPQLVSFVPSQPPPELPRIWQFSHRTALPARAPSVAS